MDDHGPKVLFLCTGNSARSILAEVLLRDRAAGRLRTCSAGSRPAGRVHPEALACLERHGHATGGLRSKSWDEFAEGEPVDFVITVCGNAAGETCPVWPGRPLGGHWGLPDPAAAAPEEQGGAFERTYRALEARIDRFLALPLEAPSDPAALRVEIEKIGSLELPEGAPEGA